MRAGSNTCYQRSPLLRHLRWTQSRQGSRFGARDVRVPSKRQCIRDAWSSPTTFEVIASTLSTDTAAGSLAPGTSTYSQTLVVDVLSDARVKGTLRRASISLVSAAFVGEPRWPDVAVFLDLPSATVEAATPTTAPSREVLEAALGDPVYMAVEEIPAFAELAQRAQGQHPSRLAPLTAGQRHFC